ncbi:MAG: hypothetical protein CMJ64_25920 [Planctomycetaceae bacterium]|nr:hypothetical protein [Planctomycetaceae bacterium]
MKANLRLGSRAVYLVGMKGMIVGVVTIGEAFFLRMLPEGTLARAPAQARDSLRRFDGFLSTA